MQCFWAIRGLKTLSIRHDEECDLIKAIEGCEVPLFDGKCLGWGYYEGECKEVKETTNSNKPGLVRRNGRTILHPGIDKDALASFLKSQS